MGLDEYRIQVVVHLKSCASVVRARDLMAEVDFVLKSSQLSEGTQKVFWQTLGSDLEVVAQESTLLLERRAAAVLSLVIVAAQTRIAEYQQAAGGDSPCSDVPA